MPGPWLRAAGSSVVGDGGFVTLLDGANFCVSNEFGNIVPGGIHGLYVFDTRLLSQWSLTVHDRSSQPLAVLPEDSFGATFLSQVGATEPSIDPALVISRRRWVGVGLREDLSLRNLSRTDAACHLTIEIDCDAADVLRVKGGRPVISLPETITARADGLRLTRATGRGSRGIDVSCSEPVTVIGRQLHVDAVIPTGGTWDAVLQVRPVLDDDVWPEPYPTTEPIAATLPARRRAAWRRIRPLVRTTSSTLATTLARTDDDLSALRIADPDDPTNTVIAAGAPWYMTLFGRDSLLTAWMALPIDPSLAVGVLTALARLQGKVNDPFTEEQPGRILHELRSYDSDGYGVGVSGAYYGSVDATPLFVMLVAELHRWGVASDVIDQLMPHVDAAMEWMTGPGDLDGDGFVEYQRQTDQGLRNQGWKDSFDSVSFADGSLAESPAALAEVQGYVYAAYRGRCELAAAGGERAVAAHWAQRARALKEAFNERFWLPDRGFFALALDRDKRPCDVLTSNLGHCLWTGIVDRDKAEHIAKLFVSPSMFTGWGLRTLAATEVAYNPMSYHNGSVWPHDTAIAVAGLTRYGFMPEARQLARGLLDASTVLGGRLPELFCGFNREEVPVPVPYATSCSPQAWAAAAPLLLLRALTGLEPDIPQGRLRLRPELPPEWLPLRVDRLPLGGAARLRLRVDDAGAHVSGLPPEIQLVVGPAADDGIDDEPDSYSPALD